MKKFIGILAALFFALPSFSYAQNNPTYVAYSGITLFVGQSDTATATSSVIRLPSFNAAGTLTVVGTGVTGSPSGCRIRLYYQSNAGGNTSVISTTAFTPATSTQTFTISPSIANGDNVYGVYDCTSTYPTAGTMNVSLSPSSGAGGAVTITSGTVTTITNPVTVAQSNTAGTTDPCDNTAVLKSSAAINVSSATTTQIVALSGTMKIYVCEADVNAVGTSPTVKFITGTGSACGTLDQTLTGAMVPSATVGTIHSGYGGTLWTSNAGDELCLVSGGTVTTETGFVTYVQQ